MTKHYHFIGIGGIGMAGLAALVLDKGHKASGSDLKDNALIEQLRAKGAVISIGHHEKNMANPDVVVVSSAIRRDNPEIIKAIRQGTVVIKRAQLLAELMHGFTGITVAGAHGKTTTSSMIAHLLTEAGLHPAAAIGGIVNNFGTNSQWGKGDYFVSEVDESDGSFLYFEPDYSVITNLDREHLDYYVTWTAIIDAYRQFIAKTASDGFIVGCGDDLVLSKLLKESGRRYQLYGFDSKYDISAENIEFHGFSSSFDIFYEKKLLARFNLGVPGKHNILNAMATILIGLDLAIDLPVIQKALAEFRGARRRFQLVGESEQIKVIDDYAHHPTEIKATLSAARGAHPGRRVVVFQPHRYSRVHSLFSEFTECWSEADEVILTDIYAASEDKIPGITSPALVDEIKKILPNRAQYVPKEELIKFLSGFVKSGDMVLMLGAGDITYLAADFFTALKLSHNNVQNLSK